jgi:anti-sigma B factor antagonist
MRPGELRIEEECAAGTATLRLVGELDLGTSELADAAIARTRGCRRLIIDLRGLAFVDSTGIQSLLRAQMTAREEGTEMVVIRGPRPVARLFGLLELDAQLNVVDDVPETAATEEP